jgi:carbon-monoxide dehydrogenase medium subunit
VSVQNTLFPTAYVFPTTVEEAIETLASWKGAARLIAGGTDLMLEASKGKIQPHCFVGTDRIHGFDQITFNGDFVQIGAAVSFTNLIDHPYINQQVPVLAEAARSVGTAAIQNVATLVGNIVNAMPAADGVVAAVALEAEAQVVGADGSKWIPVETIFLGPGKSVIDPTREIVTCIRFPVPPNPWGTAWQRIARRPSLTLPILNCGVKVALRGDRIERAVITLGPVAPRPFRATKTEVFLLDKPITSDIFAEAGRLAQGESHPRSSVTRASRAYRLAVIPSLVSDALATACRRARHLAFNLTNF